MVNFNLSNDEYALIAQPLLHASRYIKSGTELSKQVNEAISIMRHASKGKAIPSGGSYSSYLSKDEKLKNLMQMFGLS